MAGANSYGDWAQQLISPERCAELLPEFCAEVGLPADVKGFRRQLQARLVAQCAAADAGYPGTGDLLITPVDKRGVTPLLWEHVLPYGEVELNMTRRLTLSRGTVRRSRSPTCGNSGYGGFWAYLGCTLYAVGDGRSVCVGSNQ